MTKKVTRVDKTVDLRKQTEDEMRASEERYRGLLTHLDAGVVVHAADTSVIMNNPRASALLGLSDKQMRGKLAIDPKWKFLKENRKPFPIEEYPVNQIASKRQAIKNLVLGINRPATNDVVWVSVNGFPVLDDQGEISEIVISFIDITDRKQAELALQDKNEEYEALNEELRSSVEELQAATEELRAQNEELQQQEVALRESEKRYRLIAENTADLISILDMNMNFTYVSPATMSLRGFTVEEAMGQTLEQVLTPESMRLGLAVFEEELQQEANGTADPDRTRILELEEYKKDGSIIWVEVSLSFLRDKDNKPFEIIIVSRDITDRKRAEESLQQEQLFSKSIIDSLPNIYFLYNYPECKLVGWNKRHETDLGYTADELKDRHVMDFHAPENNELIMTAIKTVMEAGYGSAEDVLVTKDGRQIPYFSTAVRFDSKGKSYFMGICEDITERKQAEQSLRLFKELVEHSSDAIGMSTPEGKHYYQNEAFYRLFGNIGDNPPETVYVDKAIGKQVFDTIMGGGSWQDEVKMFKKDGTILNIFERAYAIKNPNDCVIGLVGLHTDITSRRQAEEEKRDLEERLTRSEKMEALGLLAGGVAHDLNNVLGIVVGYAELILSTADEKNPIREDLVTIMDAGQRAAAIVDDLLTLARRGVVGRKILNLNKLISDFHKSSQLRKLLSYNHHVQIKTDLEHDLLNISGSSVHLEKTLYNLVSNAAEAMTKGGTITIKTTNRYIDKPVHGYDTIRKGDYVVLSVSDTGEGISESDLKRIFEPFYTKKIMGRSGTGLGLSVVWGTVKDHLGYIDVQSEEGKGTTFSLYFLITREDIPSESVTVSLSEYMGKGQSILVVDDVKQQRDLASRLLKSLNYNVMSAASGEDAVEYLKDHKVDLLILDMIMDPGMDGLDTYKSVLKIHPKQKAIIVSGFSESDRVHDAQALGAGAYVKKPYVIEKLGMAVKEELERRNSP